MFEYYLHKMVKSDEFQLFYIVMVLADALTLLIGHAGMQGDPISDLALALFLIPNSNPNSNPNSDPDIGSDLTFGAR